MLKKPEAAASPSALPRPDTQADVRTLQALLIISILGDVAAAILTVVGGFGSLALPIVAMLFLTVLSFLLLRRGVLAPARILMPAALYVVITYIVAVGYGLHDINVIGYGLVLVLASLTLGETGAFVFMGLIVLAVFGIGIGEMQGLLKSPTSALTLPVSPVAISIVVVATTFAQQALIRLLNASLQRARAHEEEQIRANAELRTLQASLEQRVQERTAQLTQRGEELEQANAQIESRAVQFEAMAIVSQDINGIRRMDELLPRVVEVVSSKFGFYHVGIFLNDEQQQYTYLTAANSEGGKRMLERGHNLKIGEQGIVGFVSGSGKLRLARNVGADAAFFTNPDLPETQSELALPLRSGTNVFGVLDVQSTTEDAFSGEDVDVLAILADQVSLAIDNTRLYETTRRSLDEAEALYRQYLRQAWSRLPREQHLAGFRYSHSGASPLEAPLDFSEAAPAAAGEPVGEAEAGRMKVPIQLRGETIGSLVISAAADRSFNQDEIDLARAVAERVALSVENARLFDETSRRAERERLVTEITSKLRSSNDPEQIVHTALNELRSALGATQVQLIPQSITPAEDGTHQTFAAGTAQEFKETRRGNGADE